LSDVTSRPPASQWPVVAVVALGGGLGSVARYGLSRLITAAPDGFPLATLVTNLVGALLLGILVVAVTEVWQPHRLVRPALGTGVLGGFTTFSTFAVDARGLSVGVAAGYVAATLVGGPGPAVITVLLVFAGGAVGSPARYLTDRFVQSRHGGPFPLGTLLVNLVGCFILGIIAGGVAKSGWPADTRSLLGTGFCGGLTTFSTFSVETVQLVSKRLTSSAVLYIAISVGPGIALAALGWWLA
jgi:fluoride exporter